MDKLLVLLVSGAATGAIYSLVATGLTLSYAATGIFNFAYGGVAFSAAYLYYELNTALRWPIWLSGIVTVLVFAPLLGLLLDAVVFRPLARASDSAKIVTTIGLVLALPAATEWISDGIINISGLHLARSTTVQSVGFPAGFAPVPASTWHLPGHIPINSNELAVLAAALVCAVGLWILMRRTSLGLRMRAVVDRQDLARIRGVNEARTSRYAWLIGTVLAGLAGVVGAPILGGINTNLFLTVTLVAAAAVVIGGLRSIPAAFVGGLLLGMAENVVASYATFASDISGFNDSVPTAILIGALIWLGRGSSRRTRPSTEEAPPPDYFADLPTWRRATPWVLAVGFAAVYIGVLSNVFWAGVMCQGLALALVFMSFVVLTGMGGMVSLAQATFASAAGLTTGVLFDRYHLPFFGAAGLGIALTVLLGLVIALPALRLGGLPLALATLALAILGDNLLFQWNWLSNQNSGWTIPRPRLGPLNLANDRTMALCLLVVVLVTMLLINNLKRSLWGRSIAAVRSSEVAAASSGISPIRVKLALFAVSAAIAGAGGILYSSFQKDVSNSTFPYTTGLLWLASAVLFGIRRPVSAALAGVVSTVAPVILTSGFHWWSWVPSFLSWNGTQSSEIPLILFGLGAVTLARNPDGFMAASAAKRYQRRVGRASREAIVGEEPQDSTAIQEASSKYLRHSRVGMHEPGKVRLGAGPSVEEEPAPLLRIDGLRSGYGELEVLHGINLSVAEGRITGMFGANGGGKSTLCSTIAGLVPVRLGTILLGQDDVTAMPPHQRVDAGLLVAPESRGVFPGLTVDENLTLRLTPAERDEVYGRFPALSQRRRIDAGRLSGGEQQMLTLAPVVVRPPRLVVVDEPTLGLAPLAVQSILRIFLELRDRGVTILLVEEKVRDVLAIADHVAFIELGRVTWSGSRADVDEEQLKGAYLGAKL